MKTLTALVLSVLTAAGLRAQSAVAFTHVTVIDMTAATPKRDRTVLVSGDRIVAIGSAGATKIPRDAQVVDASGRFLIPGLWDMHVHLGETERSLPLYVANGVTGVRDMGGDPKKVFAWRERTASGALLGPRIVACGPIIDGPDPAAHGPTVVAGSPEEGRKAVADLARSGSDCVKVYDRLPRPVYFAIVHEAKKRRLPVVGHSPLSVTTAEASDAGQRSIEHLGTIFEGSSSIEPELRRLEAAPPPAGDPSEFPRRIAARGERMLDTYDERKAAALFRRLAKNRTWQVPTLVVKRGQAFIDDLSRSGDERLKYIPAPDREWWRPEKNFFARYRTPGYITFKKRLYRRELELVAAMQRAGVPLLTGTDVSSAWVFPGFSVHDELGLFVEAGLTPMEALQAATRGPATFLGELASSGTVERGKTADLVLLDADPLRDIRNTRKIRAVVLKGRYFPREELQEMLDRSRSEAP
jgi:amidohydrolase family protein